MKQIDFIRSLYEMTEKELESLYKLLRNDKSKFAKFIANIIYEHRVYEEVMVLDAKEKRKLNKEVNKRVQEHYKSIVGKEVTIITNVLENVITDFQKYWNYNIDFKDVKKMLERDYLGKHFSERVWENEQATAAKMKKSLYDFINGKVNVNQIKKDIEKTFNTSKYNAKRLAETEVARLHDEAFKRFCNEVDVKYIIWNAELDGRECEKCNSFHGKSYSVKGAPDMPQHPLCRCFFEIDTDREEVEKWGKKLSK